MSPPEKHPVKTRIVVLEEHPLLRHGIAHFLNSQEDMIVCGETDNIRDARHKIQESKPHVLLTALRLGTGDTLEFLRFIHRREHGGRREVVVRRFPRPRFTQIFFNPENRKLR